MLNKELLMTKNWVAGPRLVIHPFDLDGASVQIPMAGGQTYDVPYETGATVPYSDIDLSKPIECYITVGWKIVTNTNMNIIPPSSGGGGSMRRQYNLTIIDTNIDSLLVISIR